MIGLYRTHRDDLGDCVRVDATIHREFYLTKDTYEACGHQPPFSELPTEEAFEHEQPVPHAA